VQQHLHVHAINGIVTDEQARMGDVGIGTSPHIMSGMPMTHLE
jgi:hypothetical protein